MNPKHLLVVDDAPDTEALFRLTFRTKLASGAWRLSFANDGHQALSCLQSHSDIIVTVLDLAMPGLDGFWLLEHLKHTYPYIVPVVYSANDSRNSMIRAMRYGAFDYLIKPVSHTILKTSIHRAIDQYAHTNAATLHTLQQALEVQADTLQTMNTIYTAVRGSHRYALQPS